MNCFNHREVTAIGLCRSCGKGICADCAVELERGLACKGSCETFLENLTHELESERQTFTHMYESERQYIRAIRNQARFSGFISLLLGIGFVVFAILAYSKLGPYFSYFFGFFGLAIATLGTNRLFLQYGNLSKRVVTDEHNDQKKSLAEQAETVETETHAKHA